MKLRIDGETYRRLQLIAKDQNCASIGDALVLVVQLASKKLWPEHLKAEAKAAKDHATKARKAAKDDPKLERVAEEADRVAAATAERAELAG